MIVADPNTEAPHIEPPEELLTQSTDAGALAAIDAALSGEAAEPVDAAADVADDEPAAPVADEPVADEVDPAAEPVKADDAAEPAKAEGDAPKKPSDEFGELPKDVKAETAERFNTMKSRYDDLHTKFEEAQAANQQWSDMVRNTGATPEQYGQALEYLTHISQGTPESLGRAYDIMAAELKVLGEALGREVPGIVDPLAAHPDLADDVNELRITRERALELAQLRAAGRLTQATTQQRETQRTTETATKAGYDAVAAFGNQVRASDPLATAKLKAIEPMVRRVVSKLPPAEWADAVKDLYESAVVAPPAVAAEPAPRIHTTLRPTSTPGVGGGGLSKSPGSPLEAMDLALKNL